jgi:hypothetical protein
MSGPQSRTIVANRAVLHEDVNFIRGGHSESLRSSLTRWGDYAGSVFGALTQTLVRRSQLHFDTRLLVGSARAIDFERKAVDQRCLKGR